MMLSVDSRSLRSLLLAAPLAWMLGGACTLDTSGARSVGGPGAGGATTSGGGEGGGLFVCDVDADCPGFTDVCLEVSCMDSTCTSRRRTNEPCGDDAFCNAEGACLLGAGATCTGAAECNSGRCVDGVCCQTACEGGCEQCGAMGFCEPVAATEDPADECSPGVCDGARGCASGEDIVAFGFGDAGNQRILAVASSPAGESFVGGDNDGDLNVDGAPQAPDNNRDGWVAKRNADGTPAWRVYFSGQNFEEVTALASDAAGDVYVCGNYAGDVDIGVVTESSFGGRDIFVAKLAGGDGGVMWSRVYGSGSNDDCHGLAVDANNGDVVIVGAFQSMVDFGGVNATSAGNEDIFVAKLAAADGATQWLETFGASGFQVARSVAVDATGAVVVAGEFDDAFTIGATAYEPLSGQDGWVAKLAAADGTPQWSTSFGGDGPDVELRAVAVGPEGAIALGGSFTDTVDFGGGGLSASGNSDGFLVELDGAGQYRRSRRIGGDGDDRIAAVAIDVTGAVVFGGLTQGSVDFGGAAIPGGGGDDAFVGKLSVDGLELWGRILGDGSAQEIRGVATHPSRTIVVGGFFEGSYQADATTFTASNTDALYLQLLP